MHCPGTGGRGLKGAGLALLHSFWWGAEGKELCPMRADGCARNTPCLGHAVCLCQGTELGVGTCREELKGITHASGVSSGCVAGLLCSNKVWHPQKRLSKHFLFCSCHGNPWRAARWWLLCFSPTASFCAAVELHGSKNCFEHKKHSPKSAWLGLSSQRSLLPAALPRAPLGRGLSAAWGSLWCLSLWPWAFPWPGAAVVFEGEWVWMCA